jgi:hypothetical protein
VASWDYQATFSRFDAGTSAHALQTIYQQPDAATMLHVIAPAEKSTDILTDLSVSARKSRKPARAEASHGLALAN